MNSARLNAPATRILKSICECCCCFQFFRHSTNLLVQLNVICPIPSPPHILNLILIFVHTLVLSFFLKKWPITTRPGLPPCFVFFDRGYFLPNLLTSSISRTAENTHCWGKYHCMACLQFYNLGLNCCTTTYKQQNIIFVSQIQYFPSGEDSLVSFIAHVNCNSKITTIYCIRVLLDVPFCKFRLCIILQKHN